MSASSQSIGSMIFSRLKEKAPRGYSHCVEVTPNVIRATYDILLDNRVHTKTVLKIKLTSKGCFKEEDPLKLVTEKELKEFHKICSA